MATPYISNSMSLTSSKNEYHQVQTQLYALHQRADALYGKISRLSFGSNTVFQDIEKDYKKIYNEFQDQREQLIKNRYHVKQSVQPTTNPSSQLRKPSHSTQKSLRQLANIEVHEMNPMVTDIAYVLHKIEQQLKQYRFKHPHGHAMAKTSNAIHVNKHLNDKTMKKTSAGPVINQFNSLNTITPHRLYAIDLDISAEWVVASLEGRIFCCNSDGDIRIFSYSRRLYRQPLLTARFHLSIVRLISSFTVTEDYLVAYETDPQMISLHTHHGALLICSPFLYEPNMMVRCDYLLKNQIWTCSRTKRQCIQFSINRSTKEIQPVRQLDYKHPISSILIDPLDISSDEQHRIAIHDVNIITNDRLLIYSNNQYTIIPLDLIKYVDRQGSSRIERVLLVPKQSNLIIVVRVPHLTITTNLHEILIVDIKFQPPKILSCLIEPNGIQNIDLTLDGELIYTSKPPINKRIISKMYIYNLIN